MSLSLQLDQIADAFNSSGLQLGGVIPLSTTDYPDSLSAVLFCQGCPWRCRYCHNPHLQAKGSSEIELSDIFRFLLSRRGLLDAVVFSGGEPSYQDAIFAAVKSVSRLGFKVGMHTASPSLGTLEKLLEDLSWIGLDIKSLPEDYPELTGIAGSGAESFLAAKMLVQSGIRLEVRTTVHPLLMDGEKILRVAERLAEIGVEEYVLQIFRKTGCRDSELTNSCAQFDYSVCDTLRSMFRRFTVRNA